MSALLVYRITLSFLEFPELGYIELDWCVDPGHKRELEFVAEFSGRARAATSVAATRLPATTKPIWQRRMIWHAPAATRIKITF